MAQACIGGTAFAGCCVVFVHSHLSGLRERQRFRAVQNALRTQRAVQPAKAVPR
jgi:predicted GNAT superfamily acetyltransferase